MPLVAHNNLPTFDRLAEEGVKILKPETALHQDYRELHIGLLNMMPDAALAATERQFLRLIGESNSIAQFYVHLFTLDTLPRGEKAQEYISAHYESFDSLSRAGLDALIITGANVVGPDLSTQPFWQPLMEVADWAYENVTSTLCSCLATHAILEFRYGQKRVPQPVKKWGVFPHEVSRQYHPLVHDVNTRFDVPYSRWNDISLKQFQQAGLPVLVTSYDGCVHLATSHDGLRFIFFQGHPEYDTISLLKEYKREVGRYQRGEISDYPPYPENYLGPFEQAILDEYHYRNLEARTQGKPPLPFPEDLISPMLDNTWHDTAVAVMDNWVGLIYQVTDHNRKRPFMDGIDKDDPLGLRRHLNRPLGMRPV